RCGGDRRYAFIRWTYTGGDRSSPVGVVEVNGTKTRTRAAGDPPASRSDSAEEMEVAVTTQVAQNAVDRTGPAREECERTEVVIVGSGFGALAAAKRLAKAKTPFVLIYETIENLFQMRIYTQAS